MRFLITGGAGFIGLALIRHLIAEAGYDVLCLDKLVYAGNLDSLSAVESSPRYRFVRADICDAGLLSDVFRRYQPNVIMHSAVESRLDRSIDGPGDFIQTNLVGTYTLLEVARKYRESLWITSECVRRLFAKCYLEYFG